MTNLAPIPGFKKYQIDGELIVSFVQDKKNGRYLKPQKGKSSLFYRLISDDGVLAIKKIQEWRKIAGLSAAINRRKDLFTKADFYSNTSGPRNDDSCWEWSKSKYRGFGRCSFNGLTKAHEVSYFFETGVKSTDVIQTCGNRSCINPKHLKIGTSEDRKSIEAKLHVGEGLLLSKFSEEHILDVKAGIVYRSTYTGLKKKKPNYNGKYHITKNKTAYYLGFDELMEENPEEVKYYNSIYDRFWSKVDKGGPDDCWNWKAATSGGYGTFSLGYEHFNERKAHRISYTLQNGSIPKGMVVMHTCDNTRCVNPNHLKVGTNFDNMRDMVSKGRSNYKKYDINNRMIIKKSLEDGRKFKDVLPILNGFTEKTHYKYWLLSKKELLH